MKEYHDRLLILAREVLSASLGIGDAPMYELLKKRDDPFFTQKRGVFVTLRTKDGALRGCIGNLFGYQPLVDQVARLAHEAAFNDPRFKPVSLQELGGLVIEISLLTEPEPVSSWREIRVGVDGIILEHGGRSAVFLPHVATEQGWDLETTLKHLSIKAGLRANEYLDPQAAFEVFQATAFSERNDENKV